jgi:hypothetical protein
MEFQLIRCLGRTQRNKSSVKFFGRVKLLHRRSLVLQSTKKKIEETI